MHKAWRQMVELTIASVCLLGLAAGCGDENGGGSNDAKRQSYSDDGYLGMSNSNPGIPGPNMANNYAADAEFMRKSIRNVPGVAATNIMFNGPDVYVTIKLQQGIPAREISTVERQAASVLRYNFPKYDIHVQSIQR